MEHSNLRDKTLIMLVSPSGMGKSTIMDEVIKLDERFKRVRSYTTRPPRDNDEPWQYTYLTPEQLEIKRQAGDIVTQATFPTSGHVYGTTEASYSGEYCLLDTLANSVKTYRDLPFKKTVTISMTAPADDWQRWFTSRYPYMNDDALKRLQEAELSTQWSLDQTADMQWLINDDTPDKVAQRLISMVESGESSPYGPKYAEALLERLGQGIYHG